MHVRDLSAFFFFFNDTATTEIYTLSLHDALPIYQRDLHGAQDLGRRRRGAHLPVALAVHRGDRAGPQGASARSEEHTSELQSRLHLVCRLLLEKKNNTDASCYPGSTYLVDHSARA